MKKILFAFSFFVSLSCVMLSCDNTVQQGHPPFVLSKPECIIGSVPSSCTFAGIRFAITNTSERQITSITASCMVFSDMEGNNPFIGSNIIEVDFAGVINQNQQKELIINLDPYLHAEPSESYIIDNFFIKKLVFSDNSSWEDPWGTYVVRSY